MTMPHKPSRLAVEPDRRSVLKLGVAAVFGCTTLASCEFVELKGASGGPAGTGIPFSLNDPAFAALETVGGHACVAFGPIDVALFRASETEFLALERICPHAGLEIAGCNGELPVTWDPEQREITCIWHQSVFATDGSVLRGPSPRAILVFPVEYDPASQSGRIVTTGAGDLEGSALPNAEEA